MVLIDVDMIVTRPLGELIETRARRAVVAFENDRDRFVPEWGELLGLGSSAAGRTSRSGLVSLGSDRGTRSSARSTSCQDAVDFERTFWRRNDPDYPFLYADQDVLNAILCAGRDPRRARSPWRIGWPPTPPFGGCGCSTRRHCAAGYARRHRAVVLHQFFRKPWLEPMYHGVYSRLLRAPAASATTSRSGFRARWVPLRLRRGARARVDGRRRCRRPRPLVRWASGSPRARNQGRGVGAR